MPKVVTKLYSINIVCVIMHYTFKSDMPASANSLSSKAVLCQCFPLSALTTRSIAGIRRSEHITEAVASFHWLRARECIKFKLAVIVYRALHGTAPQYLSGQLQYVADLPSRRRDRLRSSTSSLFDVRPSRLVTVGDRSFGAAGPQLWNSLSVPHNISSETENTSVSAIIPSHCFLTASP